MFISRSCRSSSLLLLLGCSGRDIFITATLAYSENGKPELDVSAPRCYKFDGSPAYHYKNRPDMVPCNPDAEVSSCCHTTDICMGNSLCLNMVSNQAFALQGCTSPEWPETCMHAFVRPSSLLPGYYGTVWACRKGAKMPYCLGDNAGCCNDEQNFVYLPKFRNIHQAGDDSYIAYDEDHDSHLVENGRNKEDKRDDGVGQSDRIALGIGLSIPVVALIVGICQWLFPGLRMRLPRAARLRRRWLGRGKPHATNTDSNTVSLFNLRAGKDRSSMVDLGVGGDLGLRQHLWSSYTDNPGDHSV